MYDNLTRSCCFFVATAALLYVSVLTDNCVSLSDYREPGEEQTEGGRAVRPHPPYEHPGHCGGSQCHPPGCQPVSHPLDLSVSD